MTDIVLQDVNPRIQYTAGGGAPTVFTYPFAIFSSSDLRVYLTPVGDEPDDVAQILILNVDYTVTNNVPPSVGGNITLTTGANTGDIITIVRDLPYNFLNNFIDGGLFEATDVNTDFDSTVMMAQQNKMYDRSIGIHYNNSAVITPIVDNVLPVLSAGQTWQMNSDGTEIIAVSDSTVGGTILTPSVANKFAYFVDTNGTIGSSIFTKPAADGVSGSSMVTDGAGNLSFSLISGSLPWTVVTVNTGMSNNNGYIANAGGTLSLTLPATSTVGSIIRVCGITATGWSIVQNAGQSIIFSNHTTTVGAAGSLSSTANGDCIELICVIADTTYLVLSSIGNITFV